MRRQARRWKPSTRENNRLMLRNYLLPFAMRVAEIARPDVRRWAMSGTPGNANRTLPVLSVMMRQAELRDLRPQGSNPCRNMRRYRTTPRERFLSLDELKRLGFVLDHAGDRQAAAAVRLLLFTGARSSEITGLRWDWIRGARAVLPDSKTGRSSSRRPPAPSSTDYRARDGSRTARATARWPTSARAGTNCATSPGSAACASTTAATPSPATP